MRKDPSFPTSLELFRFVRAVANQYAAAEKVSDAEIGRAIGLESARTSRWKHGQIAINDAPRLLALAQFIGIDVTVLSQVAAGYISHKEALEIVENEREFVRFLGENVLLPQNGQSLSIVSKEGSEVRVVRHSRSHYDRPFRRSDSRRQLSEKKQDITVLLVDDDEVTLDVFVNLTGEGTGIDGVVARNASEALILAGHLRPRLIIFDLFIGQIDGFLAVRNLVKNNITNATEVIATSLVTTSEIIRNAKGAGAKDVIQRPLRARPLGKLLRDLRRSS